MGARQLTAVIILVLALLLAGCTQAWWQDFFTGHRTGFEEPHYYPGGAALQNVKTAKIQRERQEAQLRERQRRDREEAAAKRAKRLAPPEPEDGVEYLGLP